LAQEQIGSKMNGACLDVLEVAEMSEQSQAILQAALALPERERSALIQQLAETLSPEEEERWEEEFAQELERRRLEFDQGKADPTTWQDLKSELMAELNGPHL
jgi:putative addiction module component (TIGR02574 family)